MLELDMALRRQLIANAHHLNPVVIIGKEGLAENVIKELDRCLLKHELIKIKILEGDREQRTILLEQICLSLNAVPIKQIGKILIIYRINPDKKNTLVTALNTPKPSSNLKPKSRPTQKVKKTSIKK